MRDVNTEGGREPESGYIHKKYCDLQRVPKNCTGAVVRAMLLKQIEAVGARTWLNPPDLPLHLVWLMCGNDQGPDQVACDGMMDIDRYSKPSVFKVRTFCLQHQLNLIVKRGVEQLGRYWSLLAKLVNCIRSWIQDMVDTWTMRFGLESAQRVF